MTNEKQKNVPASIEAILFTMGQSVEKKTIQAALELSDEEFQHYIGLLQEEYEKPEHGLQLIKLEDAYQFCTKSEYYDDLVRVATTPVRPVMTPVMLEVLSIVAYKQPVTRGEIERIRGVSSDYSLNKLVDYGLVQEAGRLEAPGKPILFETTEEFLRKFGLESLAELPPIDDDLMKEVASEIYREHGLVMEGQLSINLEMNEDGDFEATDKPIEVET